MRLLFLIILVALTPTLGAEQPTLTLAVGGDTMFGRMTPGGWRANESGLGPWAKTFESADIAFLNLETGICDVGRSTSLLPLLWAPPDRLSLLTDSGIDVVSVANNHALDCGPDGLSRTLEALEGRGIAAAGVAPLGAVRLSDDVVLLAATMHPPPYRSSGAKPLLVGRDSDLETRVRDLRKAHPRALLLVSIHWGLERSPKPAAWQRKFARSLIDAGAHAIVGHGPHLTQPRETYGDGIILYSLGNLVFDDASELGRPTPPIVLQFIRDKNSWRRVPAR